MKGILSKFKILHIKDNRIHRKKLILQYNFPYFRYMNDLLDPVRRKFETPDMKKLINSAYPPPTKVKPGKGAAAPGADESKPSRLNIRIGRIVEVSKHPDAASLYVEKIDLNEEGGNRTIVSGK